MSAHQKLAAALVVVLAAIGVAVVALTMSGGPTALTPSPSPTVSLAPSGDAVAVGLRRPEQRGG